MAKYIAFHLPQYHSFSENDEWWGKGFTDWVNVKKAKPLFKGHYQPRVPLNENYYDMTEHVTRAWQAKVAKEYGLYGFCYYHYYFDGKLLMERPLEALLEDKDIDFPFCLCWANEPWTRAWDGKTSSVIMPQKYGTEYDWKKHFEYLLSFFTDKRYIKVNNKPLFILYRTNNIPECEKMVSYWDKECRKNGFDGIYICEEMNAFQNEPVCNNSQAVIAFEPSNVQRDRTFIQRVLNNFRSKIVSRSINSNLKNFDYKKVWDKIINQDYRNIKKKVYYGAFVSWDNTPRKGTNGIVYTNATPKMFEENMRKLNAKVGGDDFIFINAWNEWAEGAYLEPDEKYKFAYLEALRDSRK